MSIAKFSLTDCQGVEHQYEVTRFTVFENAEFQLMLGAPLMRAVASAIGTIVPILQDQEVRDEIAGALPAAGASGNVTVSIATIAKALGAANWQQAAGVLEPIPEMIIAQDGPALVTRIFKHTQRLTLVKELQGQPSVGEEVVDPNLREKLGTTEGQESAFGEGNMAEYWKAAVMVLVANFTPSGPDGSVNWKGAVSALTGGIVTL